MFSVMKRTPAKTLKKMLEYERKDGQTTTRADGCFEITFQA